MKKVLQFFGTAAIISFITAVSCELPKYPIGNEGTTQGLGGGRQPPVHAEYPNINWTNDPFAQAPDGTFNLAPLSKPIPDNFMRGVDISNCFIIEEAGGVYYDHDNNPRDIMEILVENGVNWVRLRIWNDHQMAYNPPAYAGDGDNDLLKTRAIAKRAKDAGMKFLLNFHYSDNWADPGRQQVPHAWRDLNREQLINALYEYTFDIIEELKAFGATPDMVQIGNEINPGFLITTNGTGYTLRGWDRDFPEALQAAALACRQTLGDTPIMIHFADGGNPTVAVYLEALESYGVDYDVIGLSWYPYYAPHMSINEIHGNLRDFRTRFGKETVCVEGAWAWITDLDGDDMPNLFYKKEEFNTTNQAPQAHDFVWDSGIRYIFGGPNNFSPFEYFLPASPENQARVTRLYFDMINDAGAIGFFWWAADWIPIAGLRGNWDNQTLFDFNGKALPALRVYNIQGPDQ